MHGEFVNGILTILSEPKEQVGIFKVMFIHDVMDIVGVHQKLQKDQVSLQSLITIP